MALEDQTFLLGLVFFPEGSGWKKLAYFNRGLNHSTVGHPTCPENERELNAGCDETDGEDFGCSNTEVRCAPGAFASEPLEMWPKRHI